MIRLLLASQCWKCTRKGLSFCGGLTGRSRETIIICCSTFRRKLATSAEKRKWKSGAKSKRERRLESLENFPPEGLSKKKEGSDDGNPFLFLVVFPVIMTGAVVLLRDDLREELVHRGRTFRGFDSQTAPSNTEAPLKTEVISKMKSQGHE